MTVPYEVTGAASGNMTMSVLVTNGAYTDAGSSEDAPSEYDGTVTAEESEFTAFGTISSDDYTIALDNQEIWVTVCMGIQQKQESGQTLQMIWDRFCLADCIRLWIC